jgi:hypothetical protein
LRNRIFVIIEMFFRQAEIYYVYVFIIPWEHKIGLNESYESMKFCHLLL